MEEPECEGNERHEHYILATGSILTHVHEHTKHVGEHNRLHHHTPSEHFKFSIEELSATAEYTQVPF